MSIESELLEIKTEVESNGELFKAEDVEAWAKKHPRSALHASLEWDERKAAHEYRLWQCRRLIAIHVTYEDGERRIYSLTPDRSRPGGGYRDLDSILADKSLHEILLADALDELQRVESKYERLKELKPVWKAAAKLRGKRKRKGDDRDHRASA